MPVLEGVTFPRHHSDCGKLPREQVDSGLGASWGLKAAAALDWGELLSLEETPATSPKEELSDTNGCFQHREDAPAPGCQDPASR